MAVVGLPAAPGGDATGGRQAPRLRGRRAKRKASRFSDHPTGSLFLAAGGGVSAPLSSPFRIATGRRRLVIGRLDDGANSVRNGGAPSRNRRSVSSRITVLGAFTTPPPPDREQPHRLADAHADAHTPTCRGVDTPTNISDRHHRQACLSVCRDPVCLSYRTRLTKV